MTARIGPQRRCDQHRDQDRDLTDAGRDENMRGHPNPAPPSPRRRIAPSSSGVPGTCVIRGGVDLTADREVITFLHAAEEALVSGIAHLVIDVSAVRATNTKLVAGLVHVWRLARRTDTIVELRTSTCVWNWLVLCRLSGLAAAPQNPRRSDPSKPTWAPR